MAIPQTQGERIRVAREQLGIGQSKLAKMLGVHPKTISRWENDRLAISEERMQHLAAALESEPEFLTWGRTRDELVAEFEADYRRQMGRESGIVESDAVVRPRESINPPLVLAAVHRSLAALADLGATESQIKAAHRLLMSRELVALVMDTDQDFPTAETRAAAVEALGRSLERLIQHSRSMRARTREERGAEP